LTSICQTTDLSRVLSIESEAGLLSSSVLSEQNNQLEETVVVAVPQLEFEPAWEEDVRAQSSIQHTEITLSQETSGETTKQAMVENTEETTKQAMVETTEETTKQAMVETTEETIEDKFDGAYNEEQFTEFSNASKFMEAPEVLLDLNDPKIKALEEWNLDRSSFDENKQTKNANLFNMNPLKHKLLIRDEEEEDPQEQSCLNSWMIHFFVKVFD